MDCREEKYDQLNGALEMILTDKGYITMTGTTPAYHYYIKDHLGSNRLVINQSGTVEQTNDYYPFGGQTAYAQQPVNQPYKYNGKEQQTLSYMTTLDYGARQYDPSLARWTSQDPMWEKYYGTSSYTYCVDNPIRLIDTDGQEIKPHSESALEAIRNNVPKKDREFIKIGKDGLIDRNLMDSHISLSDNYNDIKTLVNNKLITDVIVDDKFIYKDVNGNEKEKGMQYNGIDDAFVGNNNGKGVGPSTGESGFLGTTLLPGTHEHYNSPNDHVMIILNSDLSKKGQAEQFSHEGLGHALTFIVTRDYRASEHWYNGLTDRNRKLFFQINKSMNETVNNMQ
jgi:RHS repeat-associated protein